MCKIVGFLAFFLIATGATAEPWTLEPETTITVEVRWRGLKVPMRFPKMAGVVDFDQSHPENAKARINVASGAVDTGLPPADKVARSEGFLASDAFPTISFELDRLRQTSPSTADVFGTITFRGTTRPIGFKAKVLRYGPDPNAPDRFEAGFHLDGAIDRTQFGSTASRGEVPDVLPIQIDLYMASR